MCVAIPGLVESIDEINNTAIVDFSGNKINARTGLVDIEVGDYALVHAGCIIQKMNKTQAQELEELFFEIVYFFLARVFTLVLETIILVIFIDNLHFNSFIMKIISNIIVIILNFVFSKIFIFKKEKN